MKQTKQLIKRVLSFMLALMMLVSAVPATTMNAAAAEGGGNGLSKAQC